MGFSWRKTFKIKQTRKSKCLSAFDVEHAQCLTGYHVFTVSGLDLARAPRRRRLTARKKGSGYENEFRPCSDHKIEIGQKARSFTAICSRHMLLGYFPMVTSGAFAAMLKATNSGRKHYKLIWRNLYFITLNGYIVVILWWMSLKFSGRTKER